MPLNIASAQAGLANSTRATHAATHTASNQKTAADDENEQRTEDTEQNKGVFVSLSKIGLQQSDQAKKNQDIDDSDLPSGVKALLKMIRQLKEDLREATQKLQQIMSNSSLSDEERMIKAQELQAEIAGITSALSSAMGSLIKAMKDMGLSKEQNAEIIKLMN